MCLCTLATHTSGAAEALAHRLCGLGFEPPVFKGSDYVVHIFFHKFQNICEKYLWLMGHAQFTYSVNIGSFFNQYLFASIRMCPGKCTCNSSRVQILISYSLLLIDWPFPLSLILIFNFSHQIFIHSIIVLLLTTGSRR